MDVCVCANTTHVKRLHGNSSARNDMADLHVTCLSTCVPAKMADEGQFSLRFRFVLKLSHEDVKCLNMNPHFSSN